mgnify:CR=1 FL=1
MTACPQRYASIESAPTMKENDLMNCSPGDGSRRFKRAVMESRPSTKCASSPAVASGDAACGDLSRLDDDVIIDIIAHLLLRPISSLYGRKLNNSVKDGLTDVLSLLLTCTRFLTVFKNFGHAVHLEFVARGATQVTPARRLIQHNPDTAFTQQMHMEIKSSEQVHMLRSAYEGFATHCAGQCCADQRDTVTHALVRHLAKKRECHLSNVRCSILPIKEGCVTITPTNDGKTLFMHTRKRPVLAGSKRSASGHGVLRSEQMRCRPHLHMLERVDIAETTSRSNPQLHAVAEKRTSLDLGTLAGESEPLLMAASPDGTMLAYIVSVRGSGWPLPDDSWETYSRVRVWDSVSNTLTDDGTFRHPKPTTFRFEHAVNAQSLWWTSENELYVCWSTAYVHPSGHLIGNYSGYFAVPPYSGEPWHTYASYHRNGKSGEWTRRNPLAAGFPAETIIGIPQTCSASADGKEVVTLIEHDHRAETLPVKYAHFVNFRHGDHHIVDPSSVWRLDDNGVGDPNGGPSCAALSPAGDYVVCLHRIYGKITLEVLTRACTVSFVSMQKIDLTPHLSLGLQENTPFDLEHDHNAVRLPYSVTFSPCGRFALVLDRRPAFGKLAPKYNVVALDTGMRNCRHGLRALPMAPVSDLATRSVAWTESGICMQPSHGTIFLWNP